MNRHDLKQPIGWILIVLSVFVVFGTLRNKYGGGPPLHQLVPIFEIPFVVLFLAIQTGLCFWFRTRIGLVWITGAFVAGLILSSIGESIWKERATSPQNPAVVRILEEHGLATSNYDWTRHKLVAGACISGLVLGFGFAREEL